MRIQIGKGYYGITTLASPTKKTSRLTEGFRKAFNAPKESLPEVILLNTKPASQRGISSDDENGTPQGLIET
jgi:hypothetical protein